MQATPLELSAVQIRQLRKTDLPGLEWDGLYTHYRNLFQDAYRLAQSGLAVLWVAVLPESEDAPLSSSSALLPGAIIGQVFVQLESGSPVLADGVNRAYLYSFRVRSEVRNLGLGGRILAAAEADLLRRGFRFSTLNCGRENARALHFYRQHGYQVVGAEPGRWSYIDNNGERRQVNEPAWRMEKQLR